MIERRDWQVLFNRHKRTHDRGDGVEGNFNLSGEDEEEYSGEDQAGSLDDASPTSEGGGYVASSLNSAVVNGGTPPQSNGMGSTTNMGHAPQSYNNNNLQTLSMPMTISQPQAINAGGMMWWGRFSNAFLREIYKHCTAKWGRESKDRKEGCGDFWLIGQLMMVRLILVFSSFEPPFFFMATAF